MNRKIVGGSMTQKTIAQELGENIKRIRQEKNISRKNLADKVGVTEISFGKYERGESSPSLDKILEMAKFLDVSISDLVGDNRDAKDRKIFEYRLQKAIDIAKSVQCEISLLSDGKISITLPGLISVENGNLDSGKKIEVTYNISFSPIIFDNSKDFVAVIEMVEKTALTENNFFLNKLRETIFKPKSKLRETI